jgi:D-arabinose 1-dehydrogenase-like Zn-dependent alcohol dehydrogenase
MAHLNWSSAIFRTPPARHVVAIARGTDKEPLARKLGAHHYIDSNARDVPGELNKLGGAGVTLATAASSARAMSAVIDGLAPGGRLMVIGASPDAIEVSPLLLISARRSIQGWPSGTSADSEDTLKFSALTNIRPMIETMPLERAPEAYERMMSGDARIRMVLTIGL